MRVAAALSLTLTAAMCSGCVDTVFESQPGNHLSGCDQRFVGKWHLTRSEKDAASDDDLFVVIEPDCKALHFIENGKDDPEMNAKTHLAFAAVDAKSIVTVKFDSDEAPNDKAAWSNGYHYFLYEMRHQEIRLRAVNDVGVAHLIIDGKIQGRTEKISRTPGGQRSGDGMVLHNYVAGDAEAMAHAVELRGVFAEAPYLTLKPATDAEISATSKPIPSSK